MESFSFKDCPKMERKAMFTKINTWGKLSRKYGGYLLGPEGALFQRQKSALYELVFCFFCACSFGMESYIRPSDSSSGFCHYSTEEKAIFSDTRL